MTRCLTILLVIVLSGCVMDHGDFAPQQSPVVQPIIHLNNPSDVSKDDLVKTEKSISDRLTISSNQAQQSFSGLGAQISKGAEVIDAAVAKIAIDVKAVANVQVDLNNKVTAVANAFADVDVNLRAIVKVVNDLKVDVDTQATAVAELKLKIDAMVGAQVGLKNEMQQTTTSMNAGRDTFNQVNQVTKEWVEIMRNEDKFNMYTIMGIFFGLCLLLLIITGTVLELSRRRAETRASEFKAKLLERSRNDEKSADGASSCMPITISRL